MSPISHILHSTIPDPMPAAALGIGHAKVNPGRFDALLGFCNQESRVHEKMLAFNVAAFLNRSVEGGSKECAKIGRMTSTCLKEHGT